MFRLRDTLVLTELRISSEENGAESGEEARPPEKKGRSDELDVVEEDVPRLETGLFRCMVFSRRASTSLKLRFSWPCRVL